MYTSIYIYIYIYTERLCIYIYIYNTPLYKTADRDALAYLFIRSSVRGDCRRSARWLKGYYYYWYY